MPKPVFSIVLFVVLFSSTLSLAQKDDDEKKWYTFFGKTYDRAPDSLYKQLKEAKEFSDKAFFIEEIAKVHIELGNTDSVNYYGKYLEDEATNNQKDGIIDNLHLSKAYTILGKGKMLQGLYEEAMKYYLKGLEITKITDSPYLYFAHSLGLASVYIKNEEFEKATPLLDNAIEGSKNTYFTGLAKKYYGDIFYQKRNITKSTLYYNDALIDLELAPDKKLALEIKLNLGTMDAVSNRTDSALKLFEEVKNTANENKYYDLYIDAVLRIGDVYKRLDNFQAAQMILSVAHVNSVQWDRMELEKKVLQSLVDLYSDQEDYKNAYALMTQYVGVSNRIIQEQKSKEIKELEIQYQTLQKENEINSLQEEQLLKESEIKRQKTIKYAFLIGFLIFLIPISALLIVYYQKLQAQSQLNAQQEELNKQKVSSLIREQELKLVKASVEAQDEERTRIARELHDSIGGNLAAIKLQMNNVNYKSDSNTAIISQIDDTYQQVREISHNLIPSKFSQNAFTTLISEYINKLDKSSDQDIVFMPHPIEKINAIEESIQVEIFNIIQELLTNTLKYAKAKNVEIHLNLHNNSLQLLFEDNGVGYDQNKTPTGIGLQNIKSRLDKLKAQLNIDSSINRGTAVTIEIPLQHGTSKKV
ncbi:histidine kinase [Aureibaculum sp. 2210JD6-5]|uniref:tetratricopeptide repeat-containing sensor histidine kinase n=1 Tax=Aureibaculum sp. 2210JD6-5 TaxID=3103957 RepID=UPI002AAD2BF8|nr:histidine kinase [Aureibaculum sp. 2210JD6-5]MDY7394297.1 histidine kinase [Aureibaculum sp. 2210JD6-5]